MILFSDRGTPKGYSHMHGYSGHTLKFVNKEGKWTYVQVHFRIRGGFQTLTDGEAGKLAGENPDYGIQLMRDEIDAGEYPTWDVYVVSICCTLLLSSNHLFTCMIVLTANDDTRAGSGVPLQRA